MAAMLYCVPEHRFPPEREQRLGKKAASMSGAIVNAIFYPICDSIFIETCCGGKNRNSDIA
jgi:hypothetical protein